MKFSKPVVVLIVYKMLSCSQEGSAPISVSDSSLEEIVETLDVEYDNDSQLSQINENTKTYSEDSSFGLNTFLDASMNDDLIASAAELAPSTMIASFDQVVFPNGKIKQTKLSLNGYSTSHRFGSWNGYAYKMDRKWQTNFGDLSQLIPGQGLKQRFKSFDSVIFPDLRIKQSVISGDGAKIWYRFGIWNGVDGFSEWQPWTDKWGDLSQLVSSLPSGQTYRAFDSVIYPNNKIKQTFISSNGTTAYYRMGTWNGNGFNFKGSQWNSVSLKTLIPGGGINQRFQEFDSVILSNNRQRQSVISWDGTKIWFRYGDWNGHEFKNWTPWNIDREAMRAVGGTAKKTYVQWWGRVATPWAYSGNSGTYEPKFQKYNRSKHYPLLKESFNKLILTSKPDLIKVLVHWSDLQPLKKLYDSSAAYPEGEARISDVVVDKLQFDYYDDLLDLIQEHDIEVSIYIVASAYGGRGPYPFSYYKKIGWFWKRPDWPYGIANPVYHAMRHPPAILQNGLSYDWLEHRAGYLTYERLNDFRHFSQTSPTLSGEEDTSLGIWEVYESPDMVFNGYDTHWSTWKTYGTVSNIHTPIPSLSSQPYRNLLKNLYKRIGAHFRKYDISSYLVYQEASYAHLRENMCYNSGRTNNTGAGDARWYEVDYSQAEQDKYNAWRHSLGLNPEQIPYPIEADSDYEKFRKFNLAEFLSDLTTALRNGDPKARIYTSVFQNDKICGLAEDMDQNFSMTKPSVVALEPPSELINLSSQVDKLTELAIKTTQMTAAREFISFDLSTQKAQRNDDNLVNFLNRFGFDAVYVPMLVHNVHDYPHWDSEKCENICYDKKNCPNACTFRYHRPGVLPLTLNGQVIGEKGARLSGIRIGVVDQKGWWWQTTTDDNGGFTLRFSTKSESYSIVAGLMVPDGRFHIKPKGTLSECEVDYFNCRFSRENNLVISDIRFQLLESQ